MNGLETEDFQTALRLEEQRQHDLPGGCVVLLLLAVYADPLCRIFECFP